MAEGGQFVWYFRTRNYYKNIFIAKFDELERCYNNLINLSLINVALALRFMLFDSQTLLDLLNKEKQLPINFCVNKAMNFDETEIVISLMLWREVSFTPLDSDKCLQKAAFLKWTCVYYVGQSITVLDILKFYAYVRGAYILIGAKLNINLFVKLLR